MTRGVGGEEKGQPERGQRARLREPTEGRLSSVDRERRRHCNCVLKEFQRTGKRMESYRTERLGWAVRAEAGPLLSVVKTKAGQSVS